MPKEIDNEIADMTRDKQWRRILKSLETMSDRYNLGARIYEFSNQALEALCKSVEKGDADQLGRIFDALRQIGPEHIIVDLPRRKADAIPILARYPDGSLKVPEFSFNPVKWADAYDLQKRTGYVFAPREVLPIVALAAKVAFLTEFGVVMNGDADGSIKAVQTIGAKWIDQLANQGVIDQYVVTQLQTKQESLLSLQRNDLAIPEKWVSEYKGDAG